MYINHLQLKYYRNYLDLNLTLNNQINIFLGNNAQGKTNILESIYLLALAKSHRTSKEKELVHWDQSFSVIKGSIELTRGKLNLEVQLSAKGKKVKINNLEKRKLSEYIGAINVVFFGPEDLELVKGSPQHRRKFLDMEISQISTSYIYNLYQYQKIVQQRNNLLKDFKVDKKNKLELLEIWDEQLVLHGTKVIIKRIQFLKDLQKWANDIHANITDELEDLKIKYNPSFGLADSENESNISNLFRIQLQKNRNQEIQRGLTLFGPHRDDIEFYINNVNVQSFGSQGQQRTVALSVKLAEIELIYNEIGDYPILLLDDVLSELDQKRQTHLLEAIKDKVQTIITTTSIDGIDNNTIERASIFHVTNGIVQSKDEVI